METTLKQFFLPVLITLTTASLSFAPTIGKTLDKTAKSGKATRMYGYGNWHGDCSSASGIVKVLTKPEHGKLAPRREAMLIQRGRYTGSTKCSGKSIQGFVVYYTSIAGFRGADSFTIEVNYPSHPSDIDTFTVHVE